MAFQVKHDIFCQRVGMLWYAAGNISLSAMDFSPGVR